MTDALTDTASSMAQDSELMPLVRRMGIVKNILQVNVAKTDDPSIRREDLQRMQALQHVLMCEIDKINAQVEAIVRERPMRESVAKYQRGVTLLKIRRE